MRSTIALSLALLPVSAAAATLDVGPGATYSTINDALGAAISGDVIEVAVGDYDETLVISGLDIEIVGLNGSGSTSLSGAAAENLIEVTNGGSLTLSGFTLVANSPRAINVDSSTLVGTDLVVENFDITTFYAFDDGAGVQCNGGAVELVDSFFAGNVADDGPHGRFDACDVFITNTLFLTGTADDDGGAFRVDAGSNLVVTDSAFEGNTADQQGGAIYYTDAGSLEITNSTFVGNIAGNLGGAIKTGTTYDAVVLTVSASTFTNNQSTGSLGGAVYHRGAGDAQIVNNSFDNNSASGNGGAIRLFYDDAFDGQVVGNVFAGNSSGDNGGGLAVAASGGPFGTVSVLGNTFEANSSARGGGASIEDVSQADGIANVFCGNSTSTSGGGLRLTNLGTGGVWSNNSFVDNVTGFAGGGLAIFTGGYYTAGGPHSFVNNTFAGNEGTEGGNVYVANHEVEFINNIFAFAPDGGGMYTDGAATTTLDYNLWFSNTPDDATGYLTSGDFGGGAVTSDPLFVNYNGGPCALVDLSLDSGSPAIDSGDPSITDDDGSVSDIGAFGGQGLGALEDADSDGWIAAADCDDGDPAVNPDATEICDGIDNDCDGGVDDGNAVGAMDYYNDLDGDGYGDDGDVYSGCNPPAGYISVGGDCDDTRANVNPDSAEVCDELDNNCDGQVDEGVTVTAYADDDGDGFGAGTNTVETCDPNAPGFSDNADDCDDGDDTIYPGAEEVCDELDNDCDDVVDEDVTTTWYRDRDADSYGDDETTAEACDVPGGFVDIGGDCNDQNPLINPDADDLTADGKDQDCDGADGKKSADEDLLAIGGCGCSSPASPVSGAWVGALMLLFMRRRR